MARRNGLWCQPYFRIFNPWLQSQKFDPDAKYIKKWIPKLQNIIPEHLHQGDTFNKNYPQIDNSAPIVNHHYEAEYAKFLFYDAKQKG